MSLEELIELINSKTLNTKVNNYIIGGLQSGDTERIISRIAPTSPILNYETIDEAGFNSGEATNIIVDVDDIIYFNVLSLALDQMGISDKIKLETFRDLYRFIKVLRENQKSVQFIIANADKLNEEDGRILNLLLRFKSYFFNSIILLEEGRDLSTYRVDIGSPCLDNRDDYERLDLTRY